MKVWKPSLAAAVALLLVAATAQAGCPPRSTIETHVFGGGLCLVAQTFGVEQAGDAPVLAVVVHGDISDGGPATYHAGFARSLARPGVVAVALTRPGYEAEAGRTSDGHTLGRDDNYTAANVAAVGGAIAALKKHHRARRVVYVGHSGGAAIGGVLIGRRAGLIDTAVLVSCPCNIARWLHARGRRPWARSLSPSDYVHKVSAATEVVAMTGAQDDNTSADIARGYIDALARRGVNARFVLVESAGHGFYGMREAASDLLGDVFRR